MTASHALVFQIQITTIFRFNSMAFIQPKNEL